MPQRPFSDKLADEVINTQVTTIKRLEAREDRDPAIDQLRRDVFAIPLPSTAEAASPAAGWTPEDEREACALVCDLVATDLWIQIERLTASFERGLKVELERQRRAVQRVASLIRLRPSPPTTERGDK